MTSSSSEKNIKSNLHLMMALLLSVFGLPGAGHFYFKFKKAALVFTVLTLVVLIAGLVHFELNLIENARHAKGMMLSKDLILAIMKVTWNESLVLYWSLVVGLVLLWIGAVADLLRRRFTACAEGGN